MKEETIRIDIYQRQNGSIRTEITFSVRNIKCTVISCTLNSLET